MYDSDNPDSIPSGVFAAGYVDGYAASGWNARGWSRFPNARRIAVFSTTNNGDVGDVERGDMLPWELPDWIVMRRNAGVRDPWGYVNLSNWNATKTEFRLRGIPEPNWWVADYDGIAVLPAGAVAKQYADPAIIPGNPHYDLSVVNEVFGPGAGSLGDDMTDEQAAMLTSIYINLKDIFFALGMPQPNPADPSQAKSSILEEIKADIAALKAGSGGSGGTEPTKFSGTIQGTLS